MPTDPQSWERLIDVFSEAVEIAPSPERDAFLVERLSHDRGLLAEARAMLRVHESADGLQIDKKLLNPTDLAGTVVGRYRLVRLIARGGMGEVYEAEREGGAFQQSVALKLLRFGLADFEARVRFRQERQIHARLTHPLIVPLLDGGVTEDGRPYLVMQRVTGESITEYCKSRSSTLEERIGLICDVASAIEYAHRNLIVHRDLKPSNVLVNADGQARLLDFGVAKMLAPEADEANLITRTDIRVMTREYAAPEQVRGEAITTATDIYGLGVLTYELLAGERPFAAAARSGGSFVASSGACLEHALLGAEAEKASVAARRNSLPFAPRMKGDLDTIIHKAMAKDPGQRFASAEDFAKDLQRFLAGEPVSARSPSLPYRIRKFVSRNPVASAATAVCVLLLATLFATVAIQSRRVARERDVARIEQERANRVNALLVDLFAVANPENTPGGSDLTIGEFLKRAEGAVVHSRETDPAVQAELRRTLGNVYQARSQYAQARVHLEAALEQSRRLHGDTHPATAAALHDLARLTINTGPRSEAVKLVRRSLEMHRALHGEKHEAVAQSLQDLASVTQGTDQQRVLLEQALAIRRGLTLTPTKGIAENLNELGIVASASGNPVLARKYFEQSLEIVGRLLPPGHPFKFTVMGNLAVIFQRFDQLDEAERLHRSLIEERRRIVGPESHGVGTAYGNLGTLLARQGRHAEAEESFRKALTILVKVLGPEHNQVANARRNLGVIRMLRRDPQSGLVLLQEAAETSRRAAGETPAYWYMRGQEAVAKAYAGRADQAEQQLRLVVRQLERVKGPSPVNDARVQLGFVLLQTGKAAEAEALFREGLAARSKRTPPDKDSVAEAEIGLAAALDRQGKPEGRELRRRSLPEFRAWGLANPHFIALVSGHQVDSRSKRSK